MIGNIRVQSYVVRQLIVINWTGVKKIASLRGLHPKSDEHISDVCERVLAECLADGIDDKDFADNSYFHLVAASEVIAVPSACFVLERAVLGPGPAEEKDAANLEKLVALKNLDAAHKKNSIVVELGIYFVDL